MGDRGGEGGNGLRPLWRVEPRRSRIVFLKRSIEIQAKPVESAASSALFSKPIGRFQGPEQRELAIHQLGGRRVCGGTKDAWHRSIFGLFFTAS